MLRLAAAGYARYIIYWERRDGEFKKTMIVHPRHLHDLEPFASTADGFNHKWIIDFIKQMHQA